MFYAIFRIIIFLILFFIFICSQKRRKKILKKRILIFSLLITMALVVLSLFVPFENVFVTFSSPQAAFRYELLGNIDAIIEGNESTMILYLNNDTHSAAIIPKTQYGWKLGTSLTSKVLATEYYEKCLIHLYQFKDSNDYYVIIWDVFVSNSAKRNITDNINSEFHNHSNEIRGVDQVTHAYYAYIENLGDDYRLDIDGKIIRLP